MCMTVVGVCTHFRSSSVTVSQYSMMQDPTVCVCVRYCILFRNSNCIEDSKNALFRFSFAWISEMDESILVVCEFVHHGTYLTITLTKF